MFVKILEILVALFLFVVFVLPFLLAIGLKLVFDTMPESKRIHTLIRWMP